MGELIDNSVMRPSYRDPNEQSLLQQIVGSSVGKPLDDLASGKYLEGAAGLASLFAKPVTMLMAPSEAEGAINPLSLAQKAKLGKFLAKDANERALFEDYGLVHSGKGDWGVFEPDTVKQSFKSRFTSPDKYGMVESLSPSNLTLADVFERPVPELAGSKVTLRDLLNPSVMGRMDPTKKAIEINTGRKQKLSGYEGTAQHEYQHLLDMIRGRSFGANPDKLDLSKLGLLPKGYGANQHYWHNLGEIRARQNDMLNNNPGIYTDTGAVFRSLGQPYYPDRVWK